MRFMQLRSAAFVPIFFLAACSHVSPPERAAVRRGQFLHANAELSPRVAEAILRGHILPGMTEAQVRASAGTPDYARAIGRSPVTSVWLYRGARLHQDQLHIESTAVFRVLFVDHRVVLVESL